MPGVDEPHWELSRPVIVFDNPYLPAIRDTTWHELWQRSAAQWSIPDDPFDPAVWLADRASVGPVPLTPEQGYRGPTINPALFRRRRPILRIGGAMRAYEIVLLRTHLAQLRGALPPGAIRGGKAPSWVGDLWRQVAELRSRQREQLLVDRWARTVAGAFGTATMTDVETLTADLMLSAIVSSGGLEYPWL